MVPLQYLKEGKPSNYLKYLLTKWIFFETNHSLGPYRLAIIATCSPILKAEIQMLELILFDCNKIFV